MANSNPYPDQIDPAPVETPTPTSIQASESIDQLRSLFILLKLSEAHYSSPDISTPPQTSIPALVNTSVEASTQAATLDLGHAQDPTKSLQDVAAVDLDHEEGIPDSKLNAPSPPNESEIVAHNHPRADRPPHRQTQDCSPRTDKSGVSKSAPSREEDEEALRLPKSPGSRLYPCINCPCTCPIDVSSTLKRIKGMIA